MILIETVNRTEVGHVVSRYATYFAIIVSMKGTYTKQGTLFLRSNSVSFTVEQQ